MNKSMKEAMDEATMNMRAFRDEEPIVHLFVTAQEILDHPWRREMYDLKTAVDQVRTFDQQEAIDRLYVTDSNTSNEFLAQDIERVEHMQHVEKLCNLYSKVKSELVTILKTLDTTGINELQEYLSTRDGRYAFPEILELTIQMLELERERNKGKTD